MDSQMKVKSERKSDNFHNQTTSMVKISFDLDSQSAQIEEEKEKNNNEYDKLNYSSNNKSDEEREAKGPILQRKTHREDSDQLAKVNLEPNENQTFNGVKEEPELVNGNANGKKKKRRSKNEPREKDFKCRNCDKVYLSAPALANHKKKKHSDNKEKKSRGRPKKYPQKPERSAKEKAEYETFFDFENRKVDSNNKFNIDILGSMVEAYKEKKLSLNLFRYKPANEHDITKIKLYEHLSKIINEKKAIDLNSVEDAFSRYLVYCEPLSNSTYFKKVCLLTILFYDYFYFVLENEKEKEKEKEGNGKDGNDKKKKSKQKENDKEGKEPKKKKKQSKEEGTKKEKKKLTANNLPELVNYFWLNYLSGKNVLEKTEAIDLIYHFCYFLHEKKYTTTFISKNE